MNNKQRPDPDKLLAKVEKQQAKARRGKLKIFFGAAAGVGKTFAMLMAAREKWLEAQDIWVGIVDTHGRKETQALLEGLPCLALKKVEYKGRLFSEFDLDHALQKHPGIILIDELAHSNIPGSRHPKRWQDVNELLEAGIDVYTTLNVQHLESLNDDIGQILGIRVWETLPDTVFEDADDVELIDLPPDELLNRLREGKVYIPEQAKQAMHHFFRKGNLIALRELALRQTASRVDAQMLDYREDHSIRDVWQVTERLLVCIGPDNAAERLVRAGKRLASSLRAQWVVAYVETPQLQCLRSEKRDAILRVLRLSEQLGAETVTLNSPDMSQAIIDFCTERNINKIIIGKPRRRGFKRYLLGSVVDTLISHAHHIHLYLLANPPQHDDDFKYSGLRQRLSLQNSQSVYGYLASVVVTSINTILGYFTINQLDMSNLVMLYLLGVFFIAHRFGRGPSVVTALISVICFDFLLVEPYYSLSVSDSQYLITLSAMLVVGITISNLMANVSSQAKIASHRERRAAALYSMSKALSGHQTENAIVKIGVQHLYAEFSSPAVILFPNPQGTIIHPQDTPLVESLIGADLSVAQWVFNHNEMAGQGTNTLPGSRAIYFPICHDDQVLGVLALSPVNLRRFFLPEQQKLLDTFLRLIAQALTRIRFSEQARTNQMKVDTEQLRNSLLSAISHDLRTPLASIIGSASVIADSNAKLHAVEQQQLGQGIVDEAQRIANLIDNMLDMAKFETDTIKLNKQWYPLEEIVGSALNRLHHQLLGRKVDVQLPQGIPMVFVDAAMIEQVVINLLENAIRYTPLGSRLEIHAYLSAIQAKITIADYGPGIPVGEEEKIFDKFYQANCDSTKRGVGLGLAICRAIIGVHGGDICAYNRPEGGAMFVFTLPVDQKPPTLDENFSVSP